MANIIPMAGLGSRFKEAGYVLPKPLIPVSGKPMILRTVEWMPPSDTWIFLVREEHVAEHGIDAMLRAAVPGAIVHPVPGTTQGQACTCLIALRYVREEEPLFIAACDSAAIYSETEFRRLASDPSVDCVVFTLTEEERLRRKPHSFGWARVASNGTITSMAVKEPVSDDPFHDHAVLGTFWFRRACDFKEAVDVMVREDYRIAGEFYVDAVPIFLQQLGKRSVTLDVQLSIDWGTPADLQHFEEVETAVRSGSSLPLPEDRVREPFWRAYVESFR